MERFTRLLVVASTAMAGLASLATLWPLFRVEALIGAVLLVAAFAGGHLAPRVFTRIVVAGMVVAPAVLFLALGRIPVQMAGLGLFAMLGLLLATTSWTAWTLPRSWQPVIIAWNLAIACSWPVCVLRELDFVPAQLMDRGPFSGVGLDPPSVTASLVAFAALAQLVGLLWVDWVFARDPGDKMELTERDVLLPLCVGVGVSCLVSAYQGLFDLSWLSYGTWPGLGRAAGAQLDANVSGMLAALVGPIGFAMTWGRSRNLALSLAVLLLAGVGVWTSGSRSAFITYVISLAFLGAALHRQRDGHLSRRRTWVLFGAMVAIVTLLGAFGHSVGPLRRLATSVTLSPGADLKAIAKDFWERDGYGLAANDMIRDFPVFGVGIGGFEVLCTDYSVLSGRSMLARDGVQNWWRQQAVSSGLLGATLALWWTALVLVLIFRRTRNGGDALTAACARGPIVGLGVTSTFGGYYLGPVVVVTAWTLLAWSARTLRPRTELQTSRSPGTWPLVVACAVAFVFTLGQYAQARHELRPPFRAMKVGVPYAYGFQRGGVTAGGEPFWWTGPRAVMVFPAGPEVLTLEAVARHPDVATRPVRVRILVRGATVIDRQVRDHAPVAIRLVPRPGERALMVETFVDRLFADDTGASRGLMLTKRVQALAGPVPPRP